MAQPHGEWLRQADYDIDTADYMFSGRYFYSVATRYPEEVSRLQKDFTKGIVKEILSKGREALRWIKKQL